MTTCIRRPHAVWTTCRCANCAPEMRRKAKLARAGRYNRIPAEAAWAVVNELRDRGWSGWAIASASGVPKFTIERALADTDRTGKPTRFGPHISRALVNHGDPTEGTVGVHGTRRRLQGLARQGYDLETLATMTGIGFSTLAAIRNGGTTQRVKAEFHNKIRDTARDVGLNRGPSPAAIKHAERKGWPSLLTWIDVDDPHEKPAHATVTQHRRKDDYDEAVVLRVLAGDKQLRMTRAERVEVVQRARAKGWTEREIHARTGITQAASLQRWGGAA